MSKTELIGSTPFYKWGSYHIYNPGFNSELV